MNTPNSPSTPPGRRAQCAACLRPATACICACVQPVAHTTEVMVLQHPLEQVHPKGTARLLHLCLPHSRLLLGEQWSAAELDTALHAPWGAHPAPACTLLLYPPTPPDPTLPLLPPPAWDMAALQTLPPQARLRLVVIDGTWRKSRKMLYLNPPLQQLPRLPLHTLPAGRYAIRKARKPGQLSTLEATWVALRQLEPHNPALDGLLHAMDAMQAQYLQSAPPLA